MTELEEKSEEIFKVKLFSSNVSKVCLGKIKHYKGFTFRFLDELSEQEKLDLAI
jgi:hypothetical protein